MGETCRENHITNIHANCVVDLIFPLHTKAIGLSNWESIRRLGLKIEGDVL